MNRYTRLLAVGAMIGALAGCTGNAGPKEQVGTLGGAVVGGLAGSQVGGGTGQLVAIGVGTLLGSIAGAEIGRSLDRADRLYMEQATQGALERNPSGTTSSWRNPDSGNSGAVTPGAAFESNTGAPCRDYQQTVEVDGRQQTARGTACRQPDGTWKVVS